MERCPGCGKESVVVQARIGDARASLVRPTLRPASEDEKAAYLNVKAELEASAERKSAFLKLQDSIKTYKMTMDEHNFALILIYYLWDSTLENRRLTLDRFLRPANWHEQNPNEQLLSTYTFKATPAVFGCWGCLFPFFLMTWAAPQRKYCVHLCFRPISCRGVRARYPPRWISPDHSCGSCFGPCRCGKTA